MLRGDATIPRPEVFESLCLVPYAAVTADEHHVVGPVAVEHGNVTHENGGLNSIIDREDFLLLWRVRLLIVLVLRAERDRQKSHGQ